MQPLVPLVFLNLPSLYPPSFRFFYTCYSYCFLVVPMHHLQYRCKKHYTCNYHFLLHYLPSLLIFFFIMQHAGIELGQHRYDATLLTSTLCCTRWSQTAHYTCARGRSRRGTLSKMASFIVDSCRDLRFSLEMWDWRRTIAWGRCTPLTIVDRFGIKISGFTPSYEALGRLLKKKKKNYVMTKIGISHMSDFSCGETKVRNDP